MTQKQILIVEDDRIVAEDIKQRLEKAGFAVSGCMPSGEKAVLNVKENKPDLVLMDIRLEGEMDGIEAADIIRREFYIPVVYLTAYADEKLLERVKTTEPYGYIVKPFQDQELKAAIEIALYKHKMEAAQKERRLAEQRLANSEVKYHSLMESMHDSAYICSTDKRIVYMNPAMIKNIGHDATGGLCSKAIFDLDEQCPWCVFEKVQKGESVITDVHNPKDNRHYRVSHAPIFNTDGTISKMTIYYDVTDQKEARKELLSAKLLAEKYINSLPGLFYVFDELRLVKWNSQWNKITGYSDKELATKYGPDFFEGEDKMLIEERMRQVFSDGASEVEAELVTKDGRKIPYYFTGLRKYLNEKSYLIGQGVDISSHKQVEEEKTKLEKQLQQAHKMEAIGTLAGGIAHKFNNSLSGIMGNIELLKMAGPDRKNIDKYADRMITSAKDMANLANQLLAYARGGKYRPKTISLTDFIDGTLSIINHKITSSIRVESDIPVDIFKIEGDQTQIQMLLSSVIANAAEATENEDCIRITMRNEEVDEKLAKKHPGLKTGLYVCLKIIDYGKGMDEETRRRIFEPFFTTNFQGRGLGMAAVYGIVKNHNGWIGVDSEPGKGTTVSIYLPALDVQIEKTEEPKIEIPKGHGTILLIEDEEMVMDVGKTMLEKRGYRVLGAKTGKEAVEIADRSDESIDLVLLDIGLPDMGGQEVYPLLKKARPSLKVIVCSGFSVEGPAQEVLNAGAQAFIQKPFVFAELLAKIKQFIERRKSRRFKAKKGAYAIFKSSPSLPLEIMDISKGGLSGQYTETDKRLGAVNEMDELSINLEKIDFNLDNVQCKTISDIRLPDITPTKTQKVKRCGIQFGELTPDQTDKLDHFIQNHTDV